VLLLLLACEDEALPPAAIPMIQRPVLVVNTGTVPERAERVQVFLHPEQKGACLDIPSLQARVNGTPVPRLHGKVDHNDYTYDRDCDVYEFLLEGAIPATRRCPPDGSAPCELDRVEVTDGTTVVAVDVPNLFAPRTLVPAASSYRRGDEVLLRWSPGGDKVDPAGDVGVELVAGEERRFLGTSSVKVDDVSVRFTLPEDLPPAFTGEVTVEFRGSNAVQPSVRTCTWAVSCVVSRTWLPEPTVLRVK